MKYYHVEAWYKYGTTSQQKVTAWVKATSLKEARRKAKKQMTLKHVKVKVSSRPV